MVKLMDDLFRTTQAVAGMAYLESKNVIHRDLTLRNLLVAPRGDEKDKYIIKISDFGLSCTASEGFYKKTEGNIPIRWCAPEVSQQGLFTSKV